MAATLDITIATDRPAVPAGYTRPTPCPLAPRAEYGDETGDRGGCQHPSGYCGPEGCDAC